MIAMTHVPSPNLAQCELTHADRHPIDLDLAIRQHRCYREALHAAGCAVRVFDFNVHLADAVFVEDVAVVLDEIILMGCMGVESRAPEVAGWRSILSEIRTVAELPAGAKLEGGDVLRIGRDLIIGISTRTNSIAIEAVTKMVSPFGYVVHAVPVIGCLHLKTACTALDDETLLLNPNWLDCASLPVKKQIVALDQWGANVVRLPNQILTNSEHLATIDQLHRLGYPVIAVDLSEFAKAEASATCLSLLI